MAVNTNWYTMDNKVGVDLNNVQTISVTTEPSYPAANAVLGDRVQGNDGSEWIFVQASTTVSQYMAVAIDLNNRANNLTSALVASNVYSYGLAQFRATQANGGGAAGEFFWALLKCASGAGINLAASAGRGVQLYISSGTAGAFTSSVTSNAIMGIALQASIGTSASNPGEVAIRNYMLPALNMSVAGATA